MSKLTKYWPHIDQVLEAAKEDSAVMAVLQDGTKAERNAELAKHGLEEAEAKFIYDELNKVFPAGARFWWW